MSRGGRGGRGGGRGGRPALPWEDVDEPDARPSDLFPPYVVTTPRQLTPAESASVQHFLLLRRQMHSSPLYTSRRTSSLDPAAPRKTYGRDQMNALYDVKSRASLDPFTAVPTYSQRFTRTDRALPDWAARPVCREMYPPELVDTVDGDHAGRRKRRRLELSRVEALPNPEEAFGMAREGGGAAGGSILDRLDAIKDDEEEADDAEEEEDAGGADEEDEVYDDEDAGDYDAENYFDNGDDGGDDYGDEDGEGTY